MSQQVACSGSQQHSKRIRRSLRKYDRRAQRQVCEAIRSHKYVLDPHVDDNGVLRYTLVSSKHWRQAQKTVDNVINALLTKNHEPVTEQHMKVLRGKDTVRAQRVQQSRRAKAKATRHPYTLVAA